MHIISGFVRMPAAIFHSRKYEEHVRRAARENLHEGDVAVDIGANIGGLTFLAASMVGSSGRVIAVEPNPDNLQFCTAVSF